ncbi:MAG TPA: LON peptidase substrate-binding domain-containing protein [Micromonosporaceae bacterium]|nr:LON peptidase substrate-binding domain-containing protein [Micromonosporaceae bacterium]
MTSRLPLFPLGTVLFPGLVLPLHIFEERYRTLVRHLMELPEPAREFGVVAIRRGWEVQSASGATGEDSVAGMILHEVGCTARLQQVTELPDGRFDLRVVGGRRFRSVGVDRSLAYLTAEVEWLPEPNEPDSVAQLLAPRVLALFRRYLELIRSGPATEPLPEDPTVLSYAVAAATALSIDDRQSLLVAPDTASRLRAELRLLSREAVLLRQLRAVPAALAEFAVPPGPN